MTHIFTLDDVDDFSDKINLDELYEKKKQTDLQQLNTFNKILQRIHNRIKFISKQKRDQHCFFIVPEIIIGIPKYDHGECVAYLFTKLEDNGFHVKYIHPNMLVISWSHWIPDYVRNEIRKKTKINIDGYGNLVSKGKDGGNNSFNSDNPDAAMLSLNHTKNNSNGSSDSNGGKDASKYKSIKDFKGIYSADLFNQ
jgi:hypothetical protein